MFDRPSDGARVVHMRCVAANGTPDEPLPSCRLEEERVFRDGRCVSVRVRYAGVWFAPLELLRLPPLDIAECPECLGARWLAPCDLCGGVGVVGADGDPVQMPSLRVNPA